jgi:hypothetical protein
MPSRTEATIPARCKPIWATKTFSTQCGTPNWVRRVSRIFGDRKRSPRDSPRLTWCPSCEAPRPPPPPPARAGRNRRQAAWLVCDPQNFPTRRRLRTVQQHRQTRRVLDGTLAHTILSAAASLGPSIRRRFGIAVIKTMNPLLPHFNEGTGRKIFDGLPNMFNFRKCIFPDCSLAPFLTLQFALIGGAH